MFSTSCDTITYCVPSKPCVNTLCPRHKTNAPVGTAGVSTANYWHSCADKMIKPLPYPVFNMLTA